jgi:peptidylprolyl isomerase
MTAVRSLIACGFVALLLTAAGCDDDDGTEITGDGKPKVTIPDGPPPKQLVIEDLEEGTGKVAKTGDDVRVDYVMVTHSNRREIASSYGSLPPFSFKLGLPGFAIDAWDEGVTGMKVGGRRMVIAPPDKAYGAEGRSKIKPGETLVLLIDLLSAR